MDHNTSILQKKKQAMAVHTEAVSNTSEAERTNTPVNELWPQFFNSLQRKHNSECTGSEELVPTPNTLEGKTEPALKLLDLVWAPTDK